MKIVEDRLRVLRAQYQVSQETVAAHLGIPQTRFSRIERGILRLTEEEKARLLQFFTTLKACRKGTKRTEVSACQT